MPTVGLVSKNSFQRLVNTERRVKDLEDALHGLSAWKPPSTTRGNFRQGVFEENLDAPAGVTALPTIAKFRVYAPEEADPGEKLEEIENDETDLLEVYNHDPGFSARKGDYAQVRVVQNEWQAINSGSSSLLKFGRITGMAAEAIARVEIAEVPSFNLADRPAPTSDVGGGDDECPADDEVDQTLNGYIGSYLGDPTGETCYAFVGHAISSFYSSCEAASSLATCGAIIQRTPLTCWRSPASGSEPGGDASGGLMPEPVYVVVESDCEAIVKTWDSIECCGESSGAESGSLTKIGEWQALLLAKKLCCAVGECPDDPASTCG